MLIEKIKLNNIRSYADEEIEFPRGSILLSGDVGSGKSTILLAIEFALFGITNEISGASLLRNGEDKGYVELHFNINKRDVVIKRSLKRGFSVNQDHGYIIIDNKKNELTATELKQRILELLNYPQSLLTKKSLIYRYTVYTPQEEMKHILLTRKEDRLEILRKVFGIDKYKRINDNTKVLSDELKGYLKEFSGMILDLDDKKGQLNGKENECTKLVKELDKLRDEVSKINSVIKSKNDKYNEVEKNIKLLEKLRNDLNVNKLKLDYNTDTINSNNQKIKLLKNELLTYINLDGARIKELEAINLDEIKIKIKQTENELDGIRARKQEAEISKRNSDELIKKINSMENCPLCKQNVTSLHKHQISSNESNKIVELNKQISILKSREEEINDKIKDIKNNYENILSKKNELELLRFKLIEKNKKEGELNSIVEKSSKLENEVGEFKNKISDIEKDIKSLEKLEGQFSDLKKEIDELRSKDKELSIEHGRTASKIDEISSEIKSLKLEIDNKLNIKRNINYINELKDFLSSSFANLISNLEKNIMLKVHHDFDSLFRKWFEMIVDPDLLKVKLDEEFNPIIEQNGHVIDYWYLSGGEKTAAALAYRLALNQVINNLMTSLKTLDLLILDEPTDGFSDEQLDRLRNVIDELKLNQLILVSHENKMESFVDSVIRVQKSNHVSSLAH
ncbi:MAG: AAA family ATPase [Nanoarchaeota archaeon]